ncbi:MAG: histidine phosphatase family protein [Chloroflexi bacterium]|nr:histidine phosphatase family protein [Chloroflexota bacterium]
MSLSKVLFIRHGQTDYNAERRLQGALPVPLNDCGIQQSRALARYLRTLKIDALYTSPRQRAKETALIVADELQLSAIEDERLAEIAFGVFEGYTFAEVAQRFPDAYTKWESGYRPYRVPNGESRLDVQLRMGSAWDDIVSSAEQNTVAIVGHSSALMILLTSMFTALPDKRVLNTSITTLERYQEIWRLKSFAETPHLAQ